MRPIKFKCWHPGKGWIREEEVMDFNIGMLTHSTGVKFCQFTGLHDSTGKEIYEGDIVKFFEPGNMWEGESDDEGVFSVMWDSLDLQWCANFCDMENIPLFDIDTEYMTIISNIHENPELLETK